MNIHTPGLQVTPDRDEAQAALDVLRQWAKQATPTEISELDPSVARLIPGMDGVEYPALSREYPGDFAIDDSYKETLPDLQNGPSSLIRGTKQQIQHVGISNFRLPIRFHTRTGGDITLETSVTGSVSLEAEKKGINMSRIMRSFYKHAEKTFSFEVIEAALDEIMCIHRPARARWNFPSMRAQPADSWRRRIRSALSRGFRLRLKTTVNACGSKI